MTPAELAADQVPRQLQQGHPPLRREARRCDIPFELSRRLRVIVVQPRRRQHDHRAAAQIARKVDQPGIDVGLQRHDRIERDPGWPHHAVLDRCAGFLRLDHDIDDRGQRRHFAERGLARRQCVDAGDLAVILHDAEQEFQLRGVADLRLIIAIDVRRRLPPLIAAERDVAIDEHPLPRNKDIVECNQGIRFVEAAGQRIIELGDGVRRIGPSRIDLQARRVDRDRHADRMILVARDLGVDAAQEQIVGKRRARRELLRTFEDDASVTFADHAGAQRRIGLRMRWLAPVDLRRRQRIGNVEMVVARKLVEAGQVVGVMLAGRGEEGGTGGKPREEPRDVIRRAAHQAERMLGPALDHAPPRPKVFRPLRDVVAPEHRLAGPGRRVGHQLAVRRIGGNVPETGDRPCGSAERRVSGDVPYDLTVVDDLSSVVADVREVLRAGTQAVRRSRTILRRPRRHRGHRQRRQFVRL